MIRRPMNKKILVALFGGMLALAALVGFVSSRPAAVAGAPADPVAAVTTAWQLAQARGAYHFTGDVVQATVPEATLTNVGRRSTQDQLYLEGKTDLGDKAMDLRVWSDNLANGGSILIPASGLEVQVIGGKTRLRRGEEPWQESTDFTQSYAPHGDFLAYLAAMQDVTLLGVERRHDLAYTRYAFTIDGPAFARYSRDQMQRAMRERGDLPANIQLEVSPVSAQMTGDGELWVGEDGLPLRQILRLHFPPQSEEQVSAQISVNFFDYAGLPPSGATLLTDPPALWSLLAPALPSVVATTLLLAATLGGSLLLLRFRRKRIVETGIAVGMSLLLVLSPTISNLPLLRFFDAQRAQATAGAEGKAAVDIEESLRAIAAENTFDPHANPLQKLAESPVSSAGFAATAALPAATDAACAVTGGVDDPDGDGLSTAAETNPISPTVATNPNVADSDGDGVNDCVEVKVWYINPQAVDTDLDSIGDFQEIGLGTDPHNKDTDSDGIEDLTEIQGFTDPYGVKWYTDPAQPDSNQDKVADLIERGGSAGVAIDTDGDKTPDLYDTDNDNDGVPDGTDLSPFTPANAPQNPYGAGNPLQVLLNGLAPGRPATLDLQLRPLDPAHLRYAYTVLDWPEDRKGQIQDWDNHTYAQNLVDRGDIAGTSAAPAADGYGDMRLTPSLEISIDGTNGADLSAYHLPPEKDLAPYSINVITATNDGTPTGTPTGIRLYVPLSLVTDSSSGSRVAFRARIPYLGTGALWNVPHQMRMVWTVQMLMDIPCDPTDDQETAAGCATFDGSSPFLFDLSATHVTTLNQETLADGVRAAFKAANFELKEGKKDPAVQITVLTAGSHWQVKDKSRVYILRLKNGVIQVYATTAGLFFNRSQIVQRYEDDWYLTGANVTEDQGVEVGIFYEDPAVDPNRRSDDMLWSLAHGLDAKFMTPSDNNGDQVIDLDLDELARRFDRIANDGNGTTDEQRWGIPDGMRVARLSYPTQDWAVASVSTTETQKILATSFNPYLSQEPITPTLLYAQSTSYRSVGLDDIKAGGVYASLNGAVLAINLAPTPATALKPDVVHSVKWSSFCVQPAALANTGPTWSACDQETYGYEMVDRYRQSVVDKNPTDTAEMIDGRMIMMRLHYLALWNGATTVVRANGQMVVTGATPSDSSIYEELSEAGAPVVNSVAEHLTKKSIKASFFNPNGTLKTLSESRLNVLAKVRGANLARTLAGKAPAFANMKTGAYRIWGSQIP